MSAIHCISIKTVFQKSTLNVSKEGVLMISVPGIPFKHSKVINNIVLLQAKTIVSEGQDSRQLLLARKEK